MKRAILVVPALLLSLTAAVAHAAAGNSATSLTLDVVKAKIDEVEAATGLTTQAREKLIETYRKVSSHLQTAAAQREFANEFERAAEAAPQEAAAIRTAMEEKVPLEIGLGIEVIAPLPEIEAVLLKEQANRASIDAKLAEFEERIAAEAGRPDAIRARLADTNRQLADIAGELERPTVTGEATAEIEARQWLLQANRAALSAEIRALDQELLSQPMRLDQLTAERDLAMLTAERSAARVQNLEAVVLDRRRLETEKATADAEAAVRDVEGKHPSVQALAERNAEVTREIAATTKSLERSAGKREKASEQQKRVDEDFRGAKQKLDIAGLSQALGMVLQEQRRTLPDIATVRKQVAARETEISQTALRQILRQEERRNLRKLSKYVNGLVAELPDGETDEIRAELEELAGMRRKLLDQALALDRTYLRSLGELDFVERALIESVAAYDKYLAGRLLWIRTTPALTLADVIATPREVAMLVVPARWLEIGEILGDQIRSSPTFIFGLVLFGLLLWKRSAIKHSLRTTGSQVGRPTTDAFALSVHALFLSGLLAVAWPLLIIMVSWQLEGAAKATEFSRAAAAALNWVARNLLVLEFMRLVCIPGGLAEVHFRWSNDLRRSLRRELTRLACIFLPFGFVVVILLNFRQVHFSGGLGRLALLGTIVAVGLFAVGLLHPRRGALRSWFAREERNAGARQHYIWVVLAVLCLTALVVLTIAGYFYAAAALSFRLVRTIGLLFAVAIAHEFVVRWLTLTQRRLAYRAAVERRAAARLAREKPEDVANAESVPVNEEEPAVNLAALSEDTKKLLNAALWITAILGMRMVWWSVLPALGVLEEFTLWYQTTTVAGEEVQVPVTLADGAFALLIGFIAIVATRRLPALLQLAVLQRLDVTAGSQYAITTLSSYAVGAIGFLLVTNSIGLNWSEVQWLVAALGVGIGFGLQEIVANFISGLIILFERPVRVGDVVTVGDTDGVVTRIRIRATTIRTWDRKELLVPNKEFVTGRLLNWSLSDPVTRIVVRVGVAYGSDVQRALALMMEAASENPRVIAEPSPTAIFDAFGDNTLSLTLRCFVDSLDSRMTAISELHQDINRKFAAAEISIAFPQRDVHLNTVAPIDIRLLTGDSEPR